mmetsp:Transcript_2399/g.5555  ORF Transcript_2399/g.5555 Transcript_2399/m.5555 type:complete len:103 (-) Transcript_2399:579-887(-)
MSNRQKGFKENKLAGTLPQLGGEGLRCSLFNRSFEQFRRLVLFCSSTVKILCSCVGQLLYSQAKRQPEEQCDRWKQSTRAFHIAHRKINRYDFLLHVTQTLA